MDLEAFGSLQTAAGAALLVEAAGLSGLDELAASRRLRARHPAALVAAALTQVELRSKAREKFGADAARMFFTPDGLEQATHRHVATHRARRLAAAGVADVVDLGCGIGGDAIALARACGAVRGLDRDPVAVAVARANLAALGLAGRVDVGEISLPTPAGVVFADPARRGPRGRVFDPASYSPPWPVVEALLAGDAVVKLAPGLPHDLIPTAVEAEWVSLAGKLREAVLWAGRLADERVRRRATVLDPAGAATELTDRDGPADAPVAPVGAYLVEPDDAVVRAHLVAALAGRVGGWLLDPHLAYLSTDTRPPPTALARAYTVVEALPFKDKQLRAALRARDIGTVTIKKRGVGVEPEALRRRLRLTGSRPATIVLSRTPRSAVALLVEPLAGPRP